MQGQWLLVGWREYLLNLGNMQSLRVELKLGDTLAWHNIYHKFNRGHFAKNTACQYVIESCILNSPFNFHLPRLLCVVGLPVSSSSQVKPAGALSLSYQLIWYGQRSIYSGSYCGAKWDDKGTRTSWQSDNGVNVDIQERFVRPSSVHATSFVRSSRGGWWARPLREIAKETCPGIEIRRSGEAFK